LFPFELPSRLGAKRCGVRRPTRLINSPSERNNIYDICKRKFYSFPVNVVTSDLEPEPKPTNTRCTVPTAGQIQNTTHQAHLPVMNSLHLLFKWLNNSKWKLTIKTIYSQSTTNKMRLFSIYSFISVRRCTCFRRFFRPSSGAQNCTYNVRYLSDRYCYLLLTWPG